LIFLIRVPVTAFGLQLTPGHAETSVQKSNDPRNRAI